MKIGKGSLFRYRYSGKHEDVTLIILFDYKTRDRFVYNIDYKLRTGACHLLNSKYIGKATKNEIGNYLIEANAI